MGHLEGKVAAVTGGGRGIGRAVALRLASEGAKIVVADYGGGVEVVGDGSPGIATSVVGEIEREGGQAVACPADVSSMGGGRAVVETAIDAYGRIDAMVCCAGVLVEERFLELTDEGWERALAIHLTGHVSCLQAAARVMVEQSEGGRLVCFSSSTALAGAPDRPAYATAKAGVLGLAYSLAAELAQYGITTNAIVPVAATRMHDHVWAATGRGADGARPPSEAQLGRALDPANIAPMVAYLLTNDAREVNGQVFGVIGRRVLRLNHAGWIGTIETESAWTLDELVERVPQELGPDLAHHPLSWELLMDRRS